MHTPIVVLGSGPTAVFAVEFLARQGIEAMLVGVIMDASILPIPTPDGPVSLLPVFPTVPPPSYPPSTPTCASLTVRRKGSASWVRTRQTTTDSLANSLLHDEAAVAMAIKQFGLRALTAPLDEVQTKIRRAYGGTPTRRAGYVQGLSPYLAPMLEAIHDRGMQPQEFHRWSPHDRLITMGGDAEPIEYEKLVYVAGLHQLAECMMVDVALPPRAAATFSTYVSDDSLTANQLVYDLDEASPVFRAFAATDRVVVTQESQLPGPDCSDTNLERTVSEIFHGRLRRFGERVVHQDAYPVSSLTDDNERVLNDACTRLHVLRFGRNATNRYVDLHELDWEELEAWIMN